MSGGAEATVKLSCMNRDVEQDCVDCAAEALTRFPEQRAVAQWMKKELDRKYGTVWHVIVGRHFASYVGHHDTSMVYFFIADVWFLLWRTNGPAASGAGAIAAADQSSHQ